VAEQVVLDRRFEIGDARERAAPDALSRDLSEEALDEIEPGRARRREVHLEARMLGEPRLHPGCLVRRGVVQHNVHVERLLDAAVDPLQERDELLGAMAWLAIADHDPAFRVHRRIERRHAVTLVVVRHRRRAALLQR
jgi:hypothetical protein